MSHLLVAGLLLLKVQMALTVLASFFLVLGRRIDFGGQARRVRTLLKVQVAAVVVSVSVIVVSTWVLSETKPWGTSVQVWSPRGTSSSFLEGTLSRTLSPTSIGEEETFSPRKQMQASVALATVSLLLLTIHVFGLLRGLFRLRRAGRGLRTLTSEALILRDTKKVRLIYLGEPVSPFAFRSRGQYHVVLTDLVLSPVQNRRMATAHELQHIRLGHISALTSLTVLKNVFWFNPLLQLWLSSVERDFEIECDLSLLQRRDWDIRSYGQMLLDVARRVVESPGSFAMVPQLPLAGNNIRRRLIMMTQKSAYRKLHWTWTLAGTLCALALPVAVAFSATIEDRRMDIAKAQELAKKVTSSTNLPLDVNDETMKYLNMGVGTARGRLYLRKALARMERYAAMIDQKMGESSLPLDLKVVPLLESGYQNVDNGTSSGIWAFTPGTARDYGLKVGDALDERDNPEKLTDTAALYYKDLYARFKDWRLALVAYNFGEMNLESAIRKAGTRDVYRLAREGYLKPESASYLPKLMALLLVMKNPDLVKE